MTDTCQKPNIDIENSRQISISSIINKQKNISFTSFL